jgi:hypothetical protein
MACASSACESASCFLLVEKDLMWSACDLRLFLTAAGVCVLLWQAAAAPAARQQGALPPAPAVAGGCKRRRVIVRGEAAGARGGGAVPGTRCRVWYKRHLLDTFLYCPRGCPAAAGTCAPATN